MFLTEVHSPYELSQAKKNYLAAVLTELLNLEKHDSMFRDIENSGNEGGGIPSRQEFQYLGYSWPLGHDASDGLSLADNQLMMVLSG